MSETAHTPGPWAWFGGAHDFYLATTHSGRRYVMGFDRRGMRSAQPVFQVRGVMVKASELCSFVVGDKQVRGFTEARKDRSVYRYDIDGIDHPDARLIAAAPELLAALERLESLVRILPPEMDEEHSAMAQARAAISKARGTSHE